MSRIELVVAQLRSARDYTESLLDGTRRENWFRMPTEGVTHIAWQVGHMAVAEYYLALQRLRGRKQGDAELVSDELMGLFGRGSTARTDAASYPSPDEIRLVFDRVHRRVLEEVGELADSVFDEPTDKPHPMFSTKMGALLFCPQHEMLHAGQIGLLRRLLGCEPLR